MKILQQVPLKLHSTMRLGGTAAFLADIHSEQELTEALAWAAERQLPALMIGSGSNIIWQDEGFAGLILVNKMKGITFSNEGADCLVTIAAGEIWDDAVAQTAAAGLTGVEALSLIPGTAGATPVQNVGAYGQEIANTLVSVTAYDTQTRDFTTIPADECEFGYRSSRFKTTDRGRFFITAITLRLRRANPAPPFYAALQYYLEEHHIGEHSPQAIREAVIAIREGKMPDPSKVANNGSFFANPVLEPEVFAELQAKYPDIHHWPIDDGRIKVPAAWLLEHAGFQDYHDPETGMGTWPKQPLVLVNEHARSTAQLIAFRQKIVESIQDKFGITLQQEPEILPES